MVVEEAGEEAVVGVGEGRSSEPWMILGGQSARAVVENRRELLSTWDVVLCYGDEEGVFGIRS
jgi:hypothetical protein